MESDDLQRFVAPDEIRHLKLGRSLRGYDPKAVNRLLEELASSFDELSRERVELREQVAKLEKELGEQGDLQRQLRDVLVFAQRAADELRERTQQERDELIAEARAEAVKIQARAREEKERTEGELHRPQSAERELRASYGVLLHAALERLEEWLYGRGRKRHDVARGARAAAGHGSRQDRLPEPSDTRPPEPA